MWVFPNLVKLTIYQYFVGFRFGGQLCSFLTCHNSPPQSGTPLLLNQQAVRTVFVLSWKLGLRVRFKVRVPTCNLQCTTCIRVGSTTSRCSENEPALLIPKTGLKRAVQMDPSTRVTVKPVHVFTSLTN